MILRVVYASGETGLVKARDLDNLIRDERIVAFCRSDGWVRVGFDPIRQRELRFEGRGRRLSDIAPVQKGD